MFSFRAQSVAGLGHETNSTSLWPWCPAIALAKVFFVDMATHREDHVPVQSWAGVPVVCRTPLGLPVDPEVYSRNSGCSESTCAN